ncbi:unnamed protein product [Spirodela intermedia]|uniref:Uncharacterized protein n=1 Tax=Spirodela intermedia TaxID=51605 RepID=A0A7I8IMH2_SPIIN|nr:unnamed protein product [Spirodela intermedia]CAA6659036.1 unnamed protein product [Spirodela intermedia]
MVAPPQTAGEMWAGLSSALAGIMFVWMAAQRFIPTELYDHAQKWTGKLANRLWPYVHISFPEFTGERMKRSEAYVAIEAYLAATSTDYARRLKAEVGKDSSSLVLSMDEHEEVTDVFGGATVWWSSHKAASRSQGFSFYPATDEKQYYVLTFHRRHRKMVNGAYLAHVMEKGKAIRHLWSHVVFDHPATFETLALEPEVKRDILQDLSTFKESKEYYSKSTMIAAMANFLDYDVYDLELTAVKNNSMLRKLLIEITPKSIVVIEDIDCSADLTGKRKPGGRDEKTSEETEIEKAKAAATAAAGRGNEESKVTLSGLLNFIDGIWSACGGERIIVFTTNYVDKLDPALIRRGRMDKHIELSYCTFEAFKVLARNYLGLLIEAKITPADVAENLIPKTRSIQAEDVRACLENLLEALEEAKKKQEEEAAAAAVAAAAAEPSPEKEKKGGGSAGTEGAVAVTRE